jgi:hypothetical protein
MCILGIYILSSSICPPVPYSYTKQDDAFDLITSKIYTVFKRNYVFDMYDFSPEYNPGVK